MPVGYHKNPASFFNLDFHPVQLAGKSVNEPFAAVIKIQVVGFKVYAQ